MLLPRMIVLLALLVITVHQALARPPTVLLGLTIHPQEANPLVTVWLAQWVSTVSKPPPLLTVVLQARTELLKVLKRYKTVLHALWVNTVPLALLPPPIVRLVLTVELRAHEHRMNVPLVPLETIVHLALSPPPIALLALTTHPLAVNPLVTV